MEVRARTVEGWQILCVAVALAGCALPRSVVAAEPVAQEPPAAQPAPAEPAAVAPPAETPAVPATKRKVILLPVAFTVYEIGAGGTLEAVPDWTEAARANIGSSATTVLQTRAGLELIAMPELTAAEQQVLREHVALSRQIIFQANMLAGDWKARRADFDLAIDDGLAFLREKSGAEYALLLDGRQLKQSGGSVFKQIALASIGIGTSGGGMYMSASLIDLQQGKIAWFNDEQGMEVMGMTGSDVRHSDEAQSVLRRIFEPYPAIPKLAR